MRLEASTFVVVLSLITGPPVIRGGTLQWWRLPQKEWEDRIQRFKAHGFNTIELYVPWNFVERTPGKFSFDSPSLREFVELADAYGLYLYLRPGPYITNEMDGGGIPAWLLTKATKSSPSADGLITLRSNDPEFLDYTKKYFKELGKLLAPYTKTRGGPIILASVENEYNWFEATLNLEKWSRLNSQWERDDDFDPQTKDYMENLATIMREAGFDVPITTCPGDATVSGMGGARGIIPAPNIYKPDAHESYAYNTLKIMRDPNQFAGAYLNMPSLSTETDRTPAVLKRLIAGGFDGYFGFNIAGIFTPGRFNSLTMDSNPSAILDVRPERIRTGFLNPKIGLYHNVVDFYGSISPSGIFRNKYLSFRRANAFLDTFESFIAEQGLPMRAVIGEKDPASSRLQVKTKNLGATENRKQVFYWFENYGQKLLHLTNESGEDIEILPGDITFDEESYPKYTTLLLPKGDYPGPENERPIENHSSMFLGFNVSLSSKHLLEYTTSEILAIRELNGSQIVVLNGADNSQAEMRLRLASGSRITYQDTTIKKELERDNLIDFTYRHNANQLLTIEDAKGKKLNILILSRSQGARLWFLDTNEGELLLSGLDYIVPAKSGVKLSDFNFEHSSSNADILVFPKPEAGIKGLQFVGEDSSGRAFYELKRSQTPSFSSSITLKKRIDVTKTELLAPEQAKKWQGPPKYAEELEFYNGHIWYETSFELEEDPRLSDKEFDLFIESASDIVAIYLNGNYITTLVPLGTEINSKGRGEYRFSGLDQLLKQGKNVLSFRSEIWGHGSFMWPQGKLLSLPAKIPALGFDALKGLAGEARIADIELKDWKAWQHMQTEVDYDALTSELTSQTSYLPMRLEKGEISWLEAQINTSELIDFDNFFAPPVLEILGKNCKASIFLNSQLVGRWLSDELWLNQGNWFTAIRDLQMVSSPDDFPLGQQVIKSRTTHDLRLLVEDASSPSNEACEISSIRLKPAEEEHASDSGKLFYTPKISWTGRIRL